MIAFLHDEDFKKLITLKLTVFNILKNRYPKYVNRTSQNTLVVNAKMLFIEPSFQLFFTMIIKQKGELTFHSYVCASSSKT